MRIRDLAIRQKIILITMLISGAVLAIASTELYIYDRVQSRHELENSVTTIAGITADNVMGAVSFDDEKATKETLNALKSDPSIVAACAYDEMRLLSRYSIPGNAVSCPGQPMEDGLRYDGEYLHASAPILLNGEKRIGTLRITSTLASLGTRASRDLVNVGAVMVLASLFALVLSSLLQRWISRPLMDLTRTTQSVSETHDYSMRAKKYANDELGMLVDSVNEMLSQIAHSASDRELQLDREHSLRKDAEEANRLKDEFLATLSHELRTPLNAIVGWSALLRKLKPTDPSFQSGVEVIHRNAHVQTRLIEDLMDVSRITTGKLLMEMSAVRVRDVVDAAIESVRLTAASRKVEIVASHAGTEGLVQGDAGRLQQAIGNVVSNAVKFSGENGKVSIRTEASPESVRVTIADTGVGIPADFLPFVFDRFRQADGSSSRRYGGLGIGLAIARGIVESHGGAISVFSEGANKGATFQITLPVVANGSV